MLGDYKSGHIDIDIVSLRSSAQRVLADGTSVVDLEPIRYLFLVKSVEAWQRKDLVTMFKRTKANCAVRVTWA
jgi:hypothetical protein